MSRLKKENEDRSAEDAALHERIDNEMRDREKAVSDLEDKLNQAQDDQVELVGRGVRSKRRVATKEEEDGANLLRTIAFCLFLLILHLVFFFLLLRSSFLLLFLIIP